MGDCAPVVDQTYVDIGKVGPELAHLNSNGQQWTSSEPLPHCCPDRGEPGWMREDY